MEAVMSDAGKPIRSPSYPSMPLSSAVEAVEKIERQYRSNAVDRELAAKLVGYSSLSGPANKALAALASYGLLERAGKGETRVTSRARAIIHASDEEERKENLLAAASEPDLFRELRERFDGIAVPPEESVITYLNRQGFNPTAVRPAARAFLDTMRYIEELRGTESHGSEQPIEADSAAPTEGSSSKFGGAKVGDLIQWRAGGVLRLEKPTRIRWVSDDRQWVAVEGSATGIPMSEVIIESAAYTASDATPAIPPAEASKPSLEGVEWFRAKVGPGKSVVILYHGDEEIGPKEIKNLIDILTAQKSALEY